MRGLGRAFDIGSGVVAKDLEASASTGHRLHLKNYGGVAIVVVKGVGATGGDPTYTVQEHNAATGGTSQDLLVVSTVYKKEEAILDGDETWTKVTQAAAATFTGDFNAVEQVLVIEVDAAQLSTGFEWISLNITDPAGTGTQFAAVLYVMYDLAVQRAPENLAQPNA